MRPQLLSDHESQPATTGFAEFGQPLELTAASEQPIDQPGLLRHLGSAAMRQIDLLRQYGPTAFLSTHLDNSTERAAQAVKEHPRIATAAAGVAIGALGAKFGYDVAHQALAGHPDVSTLTNAHSFAPSTDTIHGNMSASQHATLTAIHTPRTSHPDTLRATSPLISKDYANLPHSADYDYNAMTSDASRAQAAGDLRVIYPDGYLPNGRPVNPGNYWYSVKETITHNGRTEVVWTSNYHQVLPVLAAHSDGARTFAGAVTHHPAPRHGIHPGRPHKMPPHRVQPPHAPTHETVPPVATTEHNDGILRHKKLLAAAGVGVVAAAALTAGLLTRRRHRSTTALETAPVEHTKRIERVERVIPAAASEQLVSIMGSREILEVIGVHGAPVAMDEQDASIVRPRIGTADFSTMESTTLTAQASPEHHGVVTLRLAMTDGRRIGTPLVEHASPSDQASHQTEGATTGFVALTCVVDRNDEAQTLVLQGVTEGGDLIDLQLGDGPTTYYVNLLADILAKDIANATSRKRKVREQARKKVTLTMASYTTPVIQLDNASSPLASPTTLGADGDELPAAPQ